MTAAEATMKARKGAWRESGSDADYAAYLEAREAVNAERAAAAMRAIPAGSTVATVVHGVSGSVRVEGIVTDFRCGTYYIQTAAHDTICVEPSKILEPVS